MNYSRVNMFITSGILVGVWSNFFYQINTISFGYLTPTDSKEILKSIENNNIMM